MKFLVTGGAGFIGSHIVDALVDRGDQVVVVDNLSTGFKENLNDRAIFYETDICDPSLAGVFEKEKPEVVIHQAAQTVVTRAVGDPTYDAQQNILGSLNVIGNCARQGVRRIVYASSGGAVYGDPTYIPADEDHPVKPLSEYGVSKYAVEHYLRLAKNRHGLDYVTLRYANVYGSRQNPKAEAGVVAIFTGLMLRGEQPTIFGSGDKTRDYVHVSDVVEANLAAIDSEGSGPYNVGTGIETRDQEVFDTIAQHLGFDGKAKYEPVREGEVHRIALDCSRIARDLGWHAQIDLHEGLSQTVAYYRQPGAGPSV
jgi:UDP-glucose 4-epimerase